MEDAQLQRDKQFTNDISTGWIRNLFISLKKIAALNPLRWRYIEGTNGKHVLEE